MSVISETNLSQGNITMAECVYKNTERNGNDYKNLDKQNGNVDGSPQNTNSINRIKPEVDNNSNSKRITQSDNFENIDLTSTSTGKLNGSSQNQIIKSNFSRSNPQLYSAAIEVHPLSQSLRENIPRNGSLISSCNVSSTSRISQINAGDLSRQTLSTSNRNASAETSTVRVASVVNTADLTKKTTPVHIPIIGYEVMEERARFTIYKLRIDDPRTGLSWMVFRRYTDFVRLYQKLRNERNPMSLPLPEKRLFRNNFDPNFLDDRMRGLQVFVNAVMRTLSSNSIVREFFCLDEPPPVGDSEPEAQAMFGAMEDTVGSLKSQIRQQEETLRYLRQKVFYLEEKMKNCGTCNPLGHKDGNTGSPDSSASSNAS